MVIVRITLNVLPEKRLEFTQTLLSMIDPVRKETGCLAYTVFSTIENKNHFSLLEEWQTREDLDHHIKSHRFGVLLGLKSLLFEPLKIQIVTVSTIEGIEAINRARIKKG